MKDEVILDFDVFSGDFGEQGDSVISNKMVVGRKEYECSNCAGVIKKGERHRCQVGKFGDLMTHRWCSHCCDAMVAQEKDEEGEDLAFDDRAGLFSKIRHE